MNRITESIIPPGSFIEEIFLKKFLGGQRWINEFERRTREFRKSQNEELDRIIEDNEGTRWGREHKFCALNHDTWQNMPITTYENFRPYIERMRKGDLNALTYQTPIALALTSGTTAEPKLIPITDDSFESEKIGAGLWNLFLRETHGERLGKILVLKGGLKEGDKKILPVKSYTELATESQWKIVQKRFVFPKTCDGITDLEHRLLISAQQAFIREPKTLVCVNPLTIMRLIDLTEENREEIGRATLRGKYIGTDIKIGEIKNEKEVMERVLSKNPLESVEVIATWTGGTQSLFLDKLFKNGVRADIRDLGYIATEGRFSIPLEDNSSSGVLNPFGIYYEFMAPDKSEMVPLRGLRADEEYNIVVTGRNGLYRYDMQDIVRFEGFYNEAPVVSFRRKDSSFSNIVGEKIHENHVVEMLRKTWIQQERVFLMADAESQRYILVLGEETKGKKGVDETILDKAMRDINPEYDSKRQSGRLKGMVVSYFSEGVVNEIDRKVNPRQDHDRFKRKYLISTGIL